MSINLDEKGSKLFFLWVCSYKLWSFSGLDLVKLLVFLNIFNFFVNLLYLKRIIFLIYRIFTFKARHFTFKSV